MTSYPNYPQPQYQQVPPVPQPVYYAPPFAIKQCSPTAAPRKTVNRLCLVVLMQTLAAFVFEIPLLALMMTANANPLIDTFAMQWLSTILVPLSTALPFFVYMLVSRTPATELLRFKRVGFSTALLCVLAGAGVCLLGNFPAIAVQEFFGMFGYESTSAVSGGGTGSSVQLFALEFFCVAILVPVMEEFAFRGVLMSSLKKYGTGFAIVTSAVIFALVHLDFANVIFALIAGLVFGFLYAKTENLWITIAIHAINNGIATIGTYAEFLFGDMGTLIDNLLMLIPIAVGILALVLLLIFKRDTLFSATAPQNGTPPLTAGQSVRTVCSAPLFWVIVAIMAAYTTTLFF